MFVLPSGLKNRNLKKKKNNTCKRNPELGKYLFSWYFRKKTCDKRNVKINDLLCQCYTPVSGKPHTPIPGEERDIRPRYAWQFLTSKPHFYLPPPGQCYKQRPQLTRINVFPEFLSLIEITFKELGLASNTIQPPPKIKQIHCRGIIYFLSIHFKNNPVSIENNPLASSMSCFKEEHLTTKGFFRSPYWRRTWQHETVGINEAKIWIIHAKIYCVKKVKYNIKCVWWIWRSPCKDIFLQHGEGWPAKRTQKIRWIPITYPSLKSLHFGCELQIRSQSIKGESPLKLREWSPGCKILHLMSSTAPHTVA